MMRFNALSTLAMSEGGRPMGRVAWGLMIHPATVTTVIDRLEKDGLVERRPKPTDRRTTLVVITKKGREVQRKAAEELTAASFGLEGLSPAEARALTKVLVPLRKSAGDIHERP
jgi:DNA-binding MarR family transcriptional regulator